jgi:hypothetical protein
MLGWLAQCYRPARLSFEESSAFDRRLRARQTSPRHEISWRSPALLTAGLAALLWLVLWPTAEQLPPSELAVSEATVSEATVSEPTQAPREPSSALSAESRSELGWSAALLESADHLDSFYADDSSVLPDDYLAIASMLGNDV